MSNNVTIGGWRPRKDVSDLRPGEIAVVEKTNDVVMGVQTNSFVKPSAVILTTGQIYPSSRTAVDFVRPLAPGQSVVIAVGKVD